MIVAIDGPAGSGKSTVARSVAVRLGYHYLDTGAMYRSVAWRALKNGVSLDDVATLTRLAEAIDIRFEHEGGSPLPTRVTADGTDVTAAIRTPRVDAAVSAVARVAGVRHAMVGVQRRIGTEGDLVAEGRDIGTVVFPDAEVKVYLTASLKERARRRRDERAQRGEDVDLAEVEEGMAARDGADSSREESPLAAAEDAHRVDTTGLSPGEVVERVVALVEDAT